MTSGSHCAVREGHSSACVITRSYRKGVFFFHILYSSLMTRSSTASSNVSVILGTREIRQCCNEYSTGSIERRTTHYKQTACSVNVIAITAWLVHPCRGAGPTRAAGEATRTPITNSKFPHHKVNIQKLAEKILLIANYLESLFSTKHEDL